MTTAITYTSFDGNKRIASGSLQANALAVKQALAARSHGAVLTFNDQTGETVEIDVCGTDADILSRLRGLTPSAPAILSEEPNAEPVPESRGRPKLGVVSREITLLPRHWEWLESQPGGASVTLRKLVEKARKAGAETDRQRHMQERTYRFMSAVAGNLPAFEEASRALFASEAERFYQHTESWPSDIRDYIRQLAFGIKKTA
ncbi:DUF2239 family protein [Oxalobacter vibrioformis]|uniref:DUF2239 family protein n=1 Tax=Oxalobacter vibrioformis TaxID=933080 RepID=A0A9E9LYY5_9BURK|nr:DUF2239 family protein [Oxalobacter vibrioformis]WAW09813.1 DUF2239 family protein [Oxalobacter vibrioformis]